MIASGHRPYYRLRVGPDGSWVVLEAPWLTLHGTTRREATASARDVIAGWLDVAPDKFDVVADERGRG
jgi:hypothetical protein